MSGSAGNRKLILSPFWSVLFLALVTVAVVFLNLPQQVTAYIIAAYVAVIALLHPLNGIYFLVLSVPFFLANSKRPYYLLLELFIYTTIVSALLHRLIAWFHGRRTRENISADVKDTP